AARLGAAADRDPTGAARDPAAADQPVSQFDQKLFAGGWNRLSRSGVGVCRHDAEPDRAGDRDHRHHHGRLSADFAGDERDHEFLQLAYQPEDGVMSDTAPSGFVRQDLVAERRAPVKTTGSGGFLRSRLLNSLTN